MYSIKRNQPSALTFVMVNIAGAEVQGLGNGLSVGVSKNGAAFVAGVGTVTEIGSGWYSYLAPASECDTLGPLAIKVYGAGCLQQNLVYPVETPTAGAVEFTYTVTNGTTGDPAEGVAVWATTDLEGDHIAARGVTDDLGQVVFFLAPETYYLWRQKIGWQFSNPDTEVVS